MVKNKIAKRRESVRLQIARSPLSDGVGIDYRYTAVLLYLLQPSASVSDTQPFSMSEVAVDAPTSRLTGV